MLRIKFFPVAFASAIVVVGSAAAGDDLPKSASEFTKARTAATEYFLGQLPATSPGLAAAKKGDFERAIDEARQALSVDGNNVPALFSRGGTYYQRDEYDRAIADVEQVIRQQPKNATAYAFRGAAFACKDD